MGKYRYFDFDGTCSGLVNKPETAFMDGNVTFAFALMVATGENIRFLTGRGKEEFKKLLYNDGSNVEESPNANKIRNAKIEQARKSFKKFMEDNKTVKLQYPDLENVVDYLLEGKNLADTLANKSCITDHGELLTVAKEDKDLISTLCDQSIIIPDNGEILIPRSKKEQKEVDAYVSKLHKEGKEFVGQLCEEFGFTTDDKKANGNFIAIEYKTSSLGVNFNSIDDKEKAFTASQKVEKFLKEHIKNAPADCFSIEQEEARAGSPPVYEIRSTASKGKGLKAFNLLQDGISFYGDSFGKVTSKDSNGREIRTGGTDRSVGDEAKKSGIKVDLYQVASSEDKDITNPADSCYPKKCFRSPSDLGLFLQKEITDNILEKCNSQKLSLSEIKKNIQR